MVKTDHYGGSDAEHNVAENALRMVCLGHKNVLCFGSDQNGERAALCGTSKCGTERFLRYEADGIADWPDNRFSEYLLRRITRPTG
ncbi:TPA: transposase [Enterobacter kobei]|nr:transposase [Enterobacter kobei]